MLFPWHKYPDTNFHELNDSWELAEIQRLTEIVNNFIGLNKLIFADPIQWNITTQYAKNMIVLDENGNAFLSVAPVPAGALLSNTNYWLEVFNFTNYVETANKNLTVNFEANTEKATSDYAVGDWLLLNNVLYKVTQAITTGDDFVVDTNIEHFTVESFIKDFVITVNATILQYKNDIDASELAYRNQLAGDIASTTQSLQAQLNAAISGVTVDSEVINARAGWNGTVYNTLGDAIRTQVEDLYSVDRLQNEIIYNGTLPTIASNGYLKVNNTIQVDGETSYITDYLPCNEGDTFYYSGTYGMNAAAAVFLNGNTVIGYEYQSVIVQRQTVITIPAGANLVRFGSYQNPFEVRPTSDYFDRLHIVGTSPLDGKKWFAFGDSFTCGNFTGYVDSQGNTGTASDAYDSEYSMYKTWAYRIMKRHNMRLINAAAGGARSQYMTSGNLYQTVPADTDYVTIMLGLNDISTNFGTEDDTDPTTWNGAWNVTLDWLRSNRPTAKIGVIIPPSWLGDSWRIEIENKCKMHGVPVLNLYRNAEVPALLGTLDGTKLAKADMDVTRSIAVTSNNVVTNSNEHPNLNCFEQMSHCIENFMQNL